jgi:hypothetical protein
MTSISSPIGQRLEYLSPMALARSAVEAVVDRRRRSVFGCAAPPATAAFENVDDAADKASPTPWNHKIIIKSAADWVPTLGFGFLG